MTKSFHSQICFNIYFQQKFIWMKNWIYITTFSEKFPNQCKEQAKSKVSANILLSYKASTWTWWLSLREKWIRLSNLCDSLQVYVYFIRLENLVYQNNPFLIYSNTIGQSSIQPTTLIQLNITKKIFLNIFHFPSTITLTLKTEQADAKSFTQFKKQKWYKKKF